MAAVVACNSRQMNNGWMSAKPGHSLGSVQWDWSVCGAYLVPVHLPPWWAPLHLKAHIHTSMTHMPVASFVWSGSAMNSGIKLPDWGKFQVPSMQQSRTKVPARSKISGRNMWRPLTDWHTWDLACMNACFSLWNNKTCSCGRARVTSARERCSDIPLGLYESMGNMQQHTQVHVIPWALTMLADGTHVSQNFLFEGIDRPPLLPQIQTQACCLPGWPGHGAWSGSKSLGSKFVGISSHALLSQWQLPITKASKDALNDVLIKALRTRTQDLVGTGNFQWARASMLTYTPPIRYRCMCM